MTQEQIGVSAAIDIRSRSTAMRIGSVAVIALLLGLVGRWPWAATWWATYSLAQLAFILTARNAARWGFVPAYLLSFIGFAIAGAPCWSMWRDNGMLGAAAASMFLSGMLAQLVASSLGARTLFLCSAAPLFAYMIAIPALYFGLAHPAQAIAGATCPLILAGYLSVVWRSQQQFLESVEESRKTAEAATRAKSEFLAVMSHEIRTPLNAVVGCAQLLEKSELTDDQRRLVELLCQGGDLLTQVINDVLEFSKIEAGRLSLEPAPCDVASFVGRMAEFWRSRIEGAGLEFRVQADEGSRQKVMLDATRMEQILSNLLSNASKFTERGAISLGVQVEGARDGGLDLVFSVADTGIGMSSEAMERLFTPFEQADGSISRRFGGTGLGLTISQKLATLHGGEIVVESTEGVGSVFRVKLWTPLAAVEEVVEPPVAVVYETQPEAPPSRLRVLVAEDNAANQMIIEHFLRPIEADIAIVGDGVEAVEACELQRFDVVLMDVQMPNMDGIEATRRIRAGAGLNANTPILALTADALDAQRDACVRAGMNGHVSKPIDARALLTSIITAVQSEHAEAA